MALDRWIALAFYRACMRVWLRGILHHGRYASAHFAAQSDLAVDLPKDLDRLGPDRGADRAVQPETRWPANLPKTAQST